MLLQPLLVLAAASVAAAHFQLNWPPTAGFVDDDEPNAYERMPGSKKKGKRKAGA